MVSGEMRTDFKLFKGASNHIQRTQIFLAIATMKIPYFVIFATLIGDSVSIPALLLKNRSRRSPQFVQNYAPGSQSQNFNCQSGGGCENIEGLQQIRGIHVSNHGLKFRWVFFLRSNVLYCIVFDKKMYKKPA